jgi:hypothetical protein
LLRDKGLGPEETDLDGTVIITEESAAKWRRERTAASRAASKTTED